MIAIHGSNVPDLAKIWPSRQQDGSFIKIIIQGSTRSGLTRHAAGFMQTAPGKFAIDCEGNLARPTTRR